MDNKIFVVTHKPYQLSEILQKKGYEIITVGKNKTVNNGIHDSDGIDNISEKNSNYCELTAVYWIWKNVNTSIKGFCHYRRFFTHDTFKYNEKKILEIDEVVEMLDDKTIILPEKKYYNITSEKLYLRCGYKKDLDTTRKVIQEKYPDYLREWDNMLIGNSGYITNMMICKSCLFDKYCEWLFEILEEVERRTDLNGYSVQEARIYGYISERLLGVWVEHNKLNVIEFQSINPETDFGLKFWLYRITTKLKLYKIIKIIMWKIKK